MCGGDVRIIHDLGKAGDPQVLDFWREEFPLNYHIARFGKPYVALMDGIVMGGGVGISAHASHRIVTERTKLAMPETGIGYFPDVGGSWLLPRAPGECGTWLGLTGNAVSAADAIYAGFADYFVPSARLTDLVQNLSQALDPDGVEAVIGTYTVEAGEGACRHTVRSSTRHSVSTRSRRFSQHFRSVTIRFRARLWKFSKNAPLPVSN